MSSRKMKIPLSLTRCLGDASFPDLNETVNSSPELEIHIRNDLTVDLDRPLADEPSRLAFDNGCLMRVRPAPLTRGLPRVFPSD